MAFEDRLEKGKIGERIVDAWLVDQGFVPYRPIEGVPHPFDRLVAAKDKRRILVVEVKAKPRRERYADTGVDQRHYIDYRYIVETYGIPVFVAFVDERLGQIYGNFLEELDKPLDCDTFPYHYPQFWGGIVYFPLQHMRPVATLTEEQCANLRRLRQSRYPNSTDSDAW